MNVKINALLVELYIAYTNEDQKHLNGEEQPPIFTDAHLKIWNEISRLFIDERIKQIKESYAKVTIT